MVSITSDHGSVHGSDGGSFAGVASTGADTSNYAPVTPSGAASYSVTGVTSKMALTYVLDHVLCLARDSGLRQSLQAAGYVKINQVINMSVTSMKALTHKARVASAVVNVHLLLSEEETLLALQGFSRHKAKELGRPLSPLDWGNITEEEFDEYQGHIHSTPTVSPTPSPTSSNNHTPSTPVVNQPSVPSAPPTLNEVTVFRRGIKRDQSLFPVLKEEKDWDDWQRRLRTQATAQGVENVLDSYYRPASHEIDLFAEQNKYMMAVFTNCVQTDYGKGLIRKYEGSNDARGLFLELERRALSSTTAIISASELLSYITTATLGRDTWNGTTTSFVLHWEEQVRLYERYVKVHSHFSPEMKRTLLQNAVNVIADLRQVKLNADQLLQANGHHVDYEDYRELLLNACARYDAEWHVRGQRSTPGTRRTVYLTDVAHDSTGDHDQFDFTFDTPVSVVSAFRTRMSGSQWYKLDAESQRVWDSLSDSAKETILSGNRSTPRPRHGPRRPGTRPTVPPDSLQVQVHEVHESYPDHNMGSDHDGVVSPDTSNVEVEVAPREDHYLAMATSRTKSPSPAALRNMLSPSHARGEPTSSNGSTKRVVNSTRYVNMCNVTHGVPTYHPWYGESLVDRGANGGLAGTDMRVITTYPDRVARVEGIDNHRVLTVPIVTAGGVLRTKTGDVIGIFHQYAFTNTGNSVHSSLQLEAHKHVVNDRSLLVPGGLQRIITVDGYEIPLVIRNGLPYLPIRPFTDTEFLMFPHIVMTSDDQWDPSLFDGDPYVNHESVLPHDTQKYNGDVSRLCPPYHNEYKHVLHDVMVEYNNGEMTHVYPTTVPHVGTSLYTVLSKARVPGLWIDDVGSNIYVANGIEAKMCTPYYVTSLGDKDVHILVTQKMLDDFQTSCLRWLGHSFGFRRENSPTPYGPKHDVWVKPNNDSHLYVTVHVDDMAVAVLRPKEFVQLIIDKYKLKLSSTIAVSLQLVYEPVSDDVTPAHYVDATIPNKWLVHGYVTGELQFVNAIPTKWFSKCPSIVEMATHESEFPLPGDTDDGGIY